MFTYGHEGINYFNYYSIVIICIDSIGLIRYRPTKEFKEQISINVMWTNGHKRIYLILFLWLTLTSHEIKTFDHLLSTLVTSVSLLKW